MSRTPHAEYAERFGLLILPADELVIARETQGNKFVYADILTGRSPSSKWREQIEALVLPPNWKRI